MKLLLLPVVILLCLSASANAAGPLTAESQQVYDTKVKPFLQATCYKCHADKKTLAGLRLDLLETDFLAGKTADVWKEIYDRIGNRTMPPKAEPRPDADAAAAVTDWITQELRNAEKRAKGGAGRIVTRRLNRTEYANTLRDLFYLDENVARALEQDLPMDGKVEGFDRGGAGLFIDEAQMAKYLETADLVLGQHLFSPQPKITAVKSLFREKVSWNAPSNKGEFIEVESYPFEHPLRNKERVKLAIGANWVKLKDGGMEFIGTGYHGDGGVDFFGGHWHSWGAAWGSGKFADGWYRVKWRAGAFKGTGKHALDEVRVWFRYSANTHLEAKASVVVDAPLDQPKEYETKVFLRAGAPEISKVMRMGWNGGPKGLVVRTPEIAKLEREWSDNYFGNIRLFSKKPPAPPEVIEAAKKKTKEMGDLYHEKMKAMTVYNAFDPDVDLEAIPRLWVESIEVEGPIGDWPPKGRTELFFDGEARTVDSQYIREIFARFLPRAYRRPVEPTEVDAVVSWVLKAQELNKLSGVEAVREGLKMVLCSPGVLLLQEPADKPRQLTDHELASRLSYFMWNTMPDAELFRLAAEKKLHESKVLEAQVRRMLADPKGMSLVRNFTGQWLKVREFPGVLTDRNQYKSYDDALRDASWNEPYEFFNEVLRSNLSILNFLDSDFLVINNRLAAHYGIEGVKGDTFRKVAILPEHRRGGVLGMAGVLTYGTDGLRTLPVRRAAYVLETLWNDPPKPPPPNVGDLPPVGKNLTVRERLEQHRKSDSCASCHAKIDPFGLALENYDAIGAWRDRQNGERFKGDKGSPPVDASGALPSGREFKNVLEYKQSLLAEKDRFVRGFVEKMLTYALGRPVGATDRETVDKIIKAIEAENADDKDRYRLQSLIQAIVASQVFQTK